MFTLFDVIICVIILLTSVVAFMRGGARDMLSLISWVGAAILTIYFYPYLYSKIEGTFVSQTMNSLAAIVPSFIGFLIILSLISATILGSLVNVRLGILDRSFGAFVGFVKGLAIVSVLHFCIILMMGEEPDWLRNGETYKLSHFGAEIVKDITTDLVLDDDTMKAEDSTENLRNHLSEIFDNQAPIENNIIEDVGNVEMDRFEEEFINEEIIDEGQNSDY